VSAHDEAVATAPAVPAPGGATQHPQTIRPDGARSARTDRSRPGLPQGLERLERARTGRRGTPDGGPLRRRLYERYATDHAGTTEAAASPAVRRDILPHLPADRGAEILDIGCGQGELVAELHRQGYRRARGVDISPEQVALAHSRGISQVARMDALTALTEASGRLGAVLATDVLEHLRKDEVLETLDAVAGALRPGGVLIARTPNALSPFGGLYQHGDFTHETSFTARSAAQVMRAAGFTQVAVFGCPPIAHSPASAVRRTLWAAVSAGYAVVLATETGSLRGHIVTQNMTIVARLEQTPCGCGS
jgi:2-polyprenyl-3-methyl-5-hydroxy-6-metoxy-1,4-benzoquinol methylase